MPPKLFCMATEIKNTLFSISDDQEEPGKVRVQALGLFKKIKKLETRLYTVFWSDILGQVSKISETSKPKAGHKHSCIITLIP